MKYALLMLAAALLTGCASPRLTLEEAQRQCTKKGGFLVVIYTTPITAAGPGEEVASPGDCLSPKNFDPTATPPEAAAPPPAAAPAP